MRIKELKQLYGIKQGGSAKQVLRRIEELERIYGIRNGSAGGNGANQYSKKEKVLDPNNLGQAKITQKDIANKLGMSLETLRNYKMLADMIPELDELVSTGIVTKTTALAIMSILSDEEYKNNENLIGIGWMHYDNNLYW